jgi:hypothetical protein
MAYFSHFGEVASVAEVSPILRRLLRAADEAADEVDREYDDPDCRWTQAGWQRNRVIAAEEAVEREARRLGVVPVYLGRQDAVSSVAYPHGGAAVLVVSCPAGGWMDIGAVKWPLEFLAPAAVAGACCTPRYGHEEKR